MIAWNVFAAHTVAVALLSYLTGAFTCAYAEPRHLPSLAGRALQAPVVTSDSGDNDADEELCEFFHEQILTKQAVSAGSITVARPFQVIVAEEEMLREIAEHNAFRPPGSRFIPPKQPSFRLNSVLRI